MAIVYVDDADDPRLAPYRDLGSHDARRRAATFVAESRQVVRMLLVSRRFGVRSALLTEASLDALSDALRPHTDVPVYVAPLPVLKRVVGFDFHRGCVALGDRGTAATLADVLATGAQRLVVLEGASNPDNVGGVLRAAQALGADAVVLSPDCCDPLYRKAVRVSMGAALDLPWAQSRDWGASLAELRAAGFHMVALTPHDGDDVADAGGAIIRPVRTALLLGAEDDGLRPETLAVAAVHLRIPMVAGVDSLNLVTACAVALDRLGWARRPHAVAGAPTRR
jgi:tRNA G18 (ribose-2'-O)-methylase SpoU